MTINKKDGKRPIRKLISHFLHQYTFLRTIKETGVYCNQETGLCPMIA